MPYAAQLAILPASPDVLSMDPITKIGTCCYCGTRAVLSLKAGTRHELACTACGAPLHNMKQVKREAPQPRPTRFASSVPAKTARKKTEKKRKKRGWGYWVREAFDELEDLFD